MSACYAVSVSSLRCRCVVAALLMTHEKAPIDSESKGAGVRSRAGWARFQIVSVTRGPLNRAHFSHVVSRVAPLERYPTMWKNMSTVTCVLLKSAGTIVTQRDDGSPGSKVTWRKTMRQPVGALYCTDAVTARLRNDRPRGRFRQRTDREYAIDQYVSVSTAHPRQRIPPFAWTSATRVKPFRQGSLRLSFW